jgi:ADP-ribose pyrophosphatase
VRDVRIVERHELTPPDAEAFLTLHRLTVQSTFTDGLTSDEFVWEAVLREHLDSVVLLLTAEIDGREHVCLRTSVRPPLLLRRELTLPLAERRRLDFLWELPAGLIERGDQGSAGIARRAAQEALEETGYRLLPDEFEILTGAPFVLAGVIPERMYYATAVVADPASSTPPTGDGSPAEERAALAWIPLDEGLALCERGEIDDMKTELGLRRLSARGTVEKEDR